MRTPRLTDHARTRCVELGIKTRRAKRIVQNRTQTYTSNGSGHDNNGIVCQSASDSEYAVVWDPDRDVILTVVPRVVKPYVRTADGFTTDPVPE